MTEGEIQQVLSNHCSGTLGSQYLLTLEDLLALLKDIPIYYIKDVQKEERLRIHKLMVNQGYLDLDED